MTGGKKRNDRSAMDVTMKNRRDGDAIAGFFSVIDIIMVEMSKNYLSLQRFLADILL